MSGAVPLLPLYAFLANVVINLPFNYRFRHGSWVLKRRQRSIFTFIMYGFFCFG